jgi:hypothetical protein
MKKPVTAWSKNLKVKGSVWFALFVESPSEKQVTPPPHAGFVASIAAKVAE